MEMSERRYYWLKLQENFFDDDTIDFIEGQENGEKYVLFYLKLCLKALKNQGKLIRYVGELLLPYDEVGIAKLTKTDVDIVRSALTLFANIGLIKRLETGEIYLTQLNEMVGTETDSAQRKRKQRARDKLLETSQTKCDNVPTLSQQSHIDIDIELDKDIDIDTAKNKKTKHKHGTYQNVLLTDEELSKLQNELTAQKAESVINNYSELKEMKGYKYKSDYLAIKKWGIRAYEEKHNSKNGGVVNEQFRAENIDF